MISKLKKNDFIKDVLTTFSGQFVVLLTNFIINKMMSIFVGVSQFGVFNIAKRSATVIGFIVLLEFGISVPRYFALYREQEKDRAFSYYQVGVYLIMITSIISLLLGISFSATISKFVFGNTSYQGMVLPMMIFAIGTCVNTFVFSAYRGAEYYYLYTTIQIATQFINMFAIIIMRDQGLSNILLWWGLSYILISIPFFFLFSKLNGKNIIYKVVCWKERVKELLIYGLPRILGDIVQFSYYLLPLVFVNREFGENSAGIFSASTGILQSFLPFFSYIGIILLPMVSKALASNSLDTVEVQIRRLSQLYLVISIFAVLFGWIFAKPIMIILYSEKYVKQLLIAKVLLLTLIPRSQFLLLRNPIDAISVKAYNTRNLTISLAVMLAVIFLSNKLIIIAWAFVISDTVLFILSYINWKKLVNRKLKENEL